MKTDRLLSITLYLINRKKATARELSEHFEVSLRTIQRDMDSLARAGVPIYAERGKEGGYRIMDGYTVDRQFFAPDELSTLTSLVGRLHDLFGDSGFRGTEEKLLSLGAGGVARSAHDTLIMDVTPWGIDEKTRELFRVVRRAVEGRRVLLVRYASASGEITEREIEPLSVIIKGAAWYVYGFCRLRKALRIFKLTRMVSAVALDETFAPDIHCPYREEGEPSADTRPRTLFVLRFSPSARGRINDYASSESLHPMPDGSIMGFFPFPEDEWVYSWILSFGPLVEVLEPPHARDRIRLMVTSLSAVYT